MLVLGSCNNKRICSSGQGKAGSVRACPFLCLPDPRPKLLVANRYYILLVNITTGSIREVKSNSTNAVAVDFDWQDQYIYWSDITFTSSSISRKPLNDTTAKVCPSVGGGVIIMVVVLMVVVVVVVGGGSCGDVVEGADGNVGSVNIAYQSQAS